MTGFRTLLVAATTICLASQALAQDGILPEAGTKYTPYKHVAGWNIYQNDTRKSCMIEGMDENKNVVQMGLTADRNVGYLGVFTQEDIDIGAGKHEITVLIGDNMYVGEAKSVRKNLKNGYRGAYFLTGSRQFLEDLQKAKVMLAFADQNGEGVLVNLQGTHKAIEAAKACQKEMN